MMEHKSVLKTADSILVMYTYFYRVDELELA